MHDARRADRVWTLVVVKVGVRSLFRVTVHGARLGVVPRRWRADIWLWSCGDLMIVKVWVRASTPRSTPPRDVTDRERSIVSVDVCTDVGKHLESTVPEKPPLHDIFPSHHMIRRHLI